MFTREKRIKSKEERKEISVATATLLLLVSCFSSISANAQCAMCRAALESDGNKAQAEAVNDGIVYLMVIPYLLVAVIGYFVYKSRKAAKKDGK